MLTHAQTRHRRPGVSPRGYAVSPRDLMMGGNATGSNYALGEVGISTLYEHPYLTGVVNLGSQEMLDEAGLVYELAIEIPVEMLGTGKSVIGMDWDATTPGIEEVAWSFSRGYMGYGARDLEPLGPPVVAAPSSVIRTQFDENATSISTRLQERLTLFRTGHSDQDAMPETTMSEVEDLVEWLCSESDLVSATVAADGMLTIAVDFPGDVRLYVEIERDSSAGAAVTRERRYASDIPGETVTDLTPEVILAAVRSI